MKKVQERRWKPVRKTCKVQRNLGKVKKILFISNEPSMTSGFSVTEEVRPSY